MKFANPLYYPVAVFVGGMTLFVGVRLLRLPSVVMLPLSVLVATGGAVVQKSQEKPETQLKNPTLIRELQTLKDSAKDVANKAQILRQEATQLLGNTIQMELLAAVQYACDRALELPEKINHLSQRLSGENSLLSIQELQQQLAELKTKKQQSMGVAQEQLGRLEASLKRNIQLAKAGEDARQAQVLSLANLVYDSAGVLQELQNKLRTADLSNFDQTQELQLLSDDLKSFQENVDLLIS